jgi:hypothetical protein
MIRHGKMGLLIGCFAVLWVHHGPTAQNRGDGLEVHEWGVFRVYNDLELANADMRAIWDSLPRFVYGHLEGRQLPRHWANIEIRDRPVIFFHAAKPMEVRLGVDFPGGRAGVWWPGTQVPAVHEQRLVKGGGIRNGTHYETLEWRLHVKEPPRNFKRAIGLPAVDDGHWIKTLRDVGADDVFAYVGEQGFGYEREKFVYYDGLFPSGKWVDITLDKKNISVANRVKHPVFDVTAIERRGDRVRLARLAKLEAGQVETLKFAETGDQWPRSGMDTLRDQLQSAGLNKAEANSLVELWKQELFLTEGITLFYRLPQTAYDRLLPLRLSPRPDKLVRVGLVQHAHCDPDLAGRVAPLVAQLDSKDFATRQEAQRRLEALGRAGYVHLLRNLKETSSLEVRQRVQAILRKHNVAAALPPKTD